MVTRYARFSARGSVAYGIVEGDVIREISGDPFGPWVRTDSTYPLAGVELQAPTVPSKVIALAGNYKSHLWDAPEPKFPALFLKPPSALLRPGGDIVIPPGTADVHYEAEMVVVIGKRAKDVHAKDALDHVLGVTCGNDVSARDWQKADGQWWRAKGCDTFAPCGPFIVSGIDYSDLLLQSRLNGETKQSQRTCDMIHDVAAIVSFISRHMTLNPGDLIFTGTPQQTSAMKPGDIVEVELEKVGVLRNRVVLTA